MSWYLNVLKNYAGFSGRARRKEYWMFTLINVVIFYGLYILGAAMEVDALTYAAAIYILAVLVPSIAVLVRRLHDIGKSGMWYFIAFVPIIGGIWLLVLTATEGQMGDNAYGPNPKEVTA